VNPSVIFAVLGSRAKHARAQTSLADAKAQVLASALVPTIAAAIAAGAFAGVDGTAAVTGWAAAAVGTVAVAFLGVVLWPRTGPQPGISDPQRLIDAIAAMSEDDELDTIAAEVIRLEAIEAAKFRWLRTAMALTGTAGILALATVIQAVTA
jgi:hypothetical protein